MLRVFILVLLSPGFFTWAQNVCGDWTQISSVSSDDLNSVIWTGTTFITCGNNGAIATSSTGVTWANRNANTQADLEDVAHGGGLIVAVGDGGVFATSTTGSLWNAGTTGEGTDLRSVAYGNQTFVAVGLNGVALSSQDGLSWTVRNSQTVARLNGIAFGNGIFAAIGEDGTVITSPDGANWTAQSPNGTLDFNDITFGDGRFVIAANLGTVLTSTDGIGWQILNVEGLQDLNGVGYNGSFFLIAADNGRAFISANGLTWEEQSNGLSGPLLDGAGNAEILVLVSEFGSSFFSQCSDGSFDDNPLSVIPWVVDNAGFVSRLALYNDNNFLVEATLLAVTREGDTVEEDVFVPANGLFVTEAGDLFPGLSGYSLFIFANTSGIFPSFLTFNIEEQSGGNSPSQTRGAFFADLTDTLLFGYVPGDQIPALVIVNPEVNAAPALVTFTLFGADGTELAEKTQSLTGNQPLAVLITDLFENTAIPINATVKATSNAGARLAGTTFVFNQQRQPSMTGAFSLP